MFNDIVQICSWYVNQGLALRAPGGNYNRPLPEVGSYKRWKKSWEWMRSTNFGWDTFSYDDNTTAPKFTAETFRRYHQLLPQRNFE